MSGEKGLGEILGEIEALDKIIGILDKADKAGTAILKQVQANLGASALFTTYFNPMGTNEEISARRAKLMRRLSSTDLRAAMRAARAMAQAIDQHLTRQEVVSRMDQIRKEQTR